MNGKQIKKIRKEINKSVNEKLETKNAEIVNQIYDRFNSYTFGKRFKMAIKLIFKKL